MGMKDHLVIHHPQESGCRMWTPVIPPAIDSQASVVQQAPSSGKPSVCAPEGIKPAQGGKGILVP